MTKLPVYFISHGSPDLLIREAPASKFLKELSLPMEDVKAILVVSAHWETEIPSITGIVKPETIHDFYGFPEELYKINYPVSGDPDLAEDICNVLKKHNVEAEIDKERGLDHGAWMPLYLALPECQIPVLQLSIQPNETAEYHYSIGKAVSQLRNKGVIIIGSGNITHNLRSALREKSDEHLSYAEEFEAWLHNSLVKRDYDTILDWINKAPHAKWNHPTDDHILPLFTVLGASGNDEPKRIHQSYDYNVLSMGSYIFGES